MMAKSRPEDEERHDAEDVECGWVLELPPLPPLPRLIAVPVTGQDEAQDAPSVEPASALRPWSPEGHIRIDTEGEPGTAAWNISCDQAELLYRGVEQYGRAGDLNLMALLLHIDRDDITHAPSCPAQHRDEALEVWARAANARLAKDE